MITPIKTLAGLLLIACGGVAAAQPAIYSNASSDPTIPSLATGTLTSSGVPAPAGGQWSELQASAGACNAVGGLASHLTGTDGSFRLADDFIVTGNPGWRVDAVTLYAYQPGATGPNSPFGGVNIRIWNGRPGDAGSAIVFGDTTTNRMTSSSATGLFRTFNTTTAPFPAIPDASKAIWATTVNLGQTSLSPGHYWIDWQYTTVVAGGEAFSPPATMTAIRTQAGWNARQFSPSLGWTDPIDAGKPSASVDVALDLPFILYGFVGTPPCSADFNGDGDIGTDADIEAFFACIAGNCCATCGPADFNGDGDIATDADIESFFRVLAGQPC